MEYIIGLILAIIVIIIVGLILRKRLYDSVDYYESWKLDIMNRNVAQELSKVKDLNLQGDTKDYFEDWKEAWDTILSEDLANVEELLYDTEHAADRYKFPTAKKHIKKMESILVEIEKRIESILTELHELLETEEINRKEVEQLEPFLADLRKQLSQKRYQFDRAEVRFEVDLEETEEKLKQYHELIEEGNYIQATDIVKHAKERLEYIQKEMEQFPTLYKQCKHELPAQLDELSRGLQEMKSDGYYIDHLDFAREVNEFQSRLLEAVRLLEKEGIEEVQSIVPEIEERVAEMYQLLEKEAIAKSFVESKMPNYERALENFETEFQHTKTEVEELKQAYYFEDTDLEKYMVLEKMVSQLQEQLKDLVNKIEMNNQAHTKLRADLEEGFKQLDTIKEEHEQFKKRIQNLRKDEIEARKEIKAMNDKIYQTHRRLKMGNLPGVPNYIWTMIEEASNKSNRVLQALDDQPLDIVAVQESLNEAKTAVNNTIDHTNTMLEQAHLTERVIQYANRYRSANPMLAAKLNDSEDLFRRAEYELALEQAVSAVEEVEPGALHKIEKYEEVTGS